MKLTKRDLKRIIREEKQKLDENIHNPTDDAAYIHVQMELEQLIERLADKFYDGELGNGAFEAKMAGDNVSHYILTEAAKLARRK